MVDIHSRYKLYAFGYTPADVREAAPSNRDLYKDTSPYVFSSSRALTHECSSKPMKDLTAPNLWEAHIFSHGLRQTVDDANALRTKSSRETGIQPPEKLLFHVGIRGSNDGDFLYPRSVSVTFNGDIVIADTSNHRIQIFNQFGVFIRKFGTQGNHPGELNYPNCVSVMFNDDICVTELKNKRVQVFRQGGALKSTFVTSGKPCCVETDEKYNFYVGTTSKTVEIYDRNGKQLRIVVTTVNTSRKYPILLCVNDDDQIIVCDTKTCFIKFFSFEGELKSQFHLESPYEGLTVQPSAICLDTMGQILIADSLNHTVNVYNRQGEVVKTAVGPTDNLGPAQSCCVGPEGHLIVTEFSINGEHSLKMFRFTECVCHFWRPGSSKRRARDTFYTQVDYQSAMMIISDS